MAGHQNVCELRRRRACVNENARSQPYFIVIHIPPYFFFFFFLFVVLEVDEDDAALGAVVAMVVGVEAEELDDPGPELAAPGGFPEFKIMSASPGLARPLDAITCNSNWASLLNFNLSC